MSACSTKYIRRSQAITYLLEHITRCPDNELSIILNEIFGGERPRNDRLGACLDFRVDDVEADRQEKLDDTDRNI